MTLFTQSEILLGNVSLAYMPLKWAKNKEAGSVSDRTHHEILYEIKLFSLLIPCDFFCTTGSDDIGYVNSC
jgi:hypothetical protein